MTSPPLVARILTVSKWADTTARWRGVHPFPFREDTTDPFCTRRATALVVALVRRVVEGGVAGVVPVVDHGALDDEEVDQVRVAVGARQVKGLVPVLVLCRDVRLCERERRMNLGQLEKVKLSLSLARLGWLVGFVSLAARTYRS